MISEFDRPKGKIPEDQKHLVHLLRRPPEKGATAKCATCHLVFRTDASAWTVNRTDHAFNRFKGAYRACTPVDGQGS
jgi:hypothetical protein